MELSGTSVAVIGLGVSGMAAARLALAEGAEVYVSDSRQDVAVAARGADLEAAGASVELGRHDVERVARAGLVVVSPGIAPDAPVLGALAERGVRWISEPELAARFFAGSLIAVTGTNGKTTVTLLVEHLLREAGVRAAAGGNVGGGLAPAASDLVRMDKPLDWWVLEMSSFQLAGVETFRPDIGIVTNLSPDHLDRYENVAAYYADKAHLFDSADERSVWVLPSEDDVVDRLIDDAPGRRYYFGETPLQAEGGSSGQAFVEGDRLTLLVDGALEQLCPVVDLPLLGRHNVVNALAASLAARLAGAEVAAIARGLRSARPLPHRLEPVAERAGVLWVNDSKATNLAATRSALESMDRPVVLLVGGKDKGEAFGPLAAAFPDRVRAVVAYGAVGPRVAGELLAARPGGGGAPEGRRTSVEVVDGGLDDVVARAAALARPGDVVLLSPACSSFDMFESYEHRGRAFAELARGRS
jgi:UDP-N-acetylmuramoylalanine--D-glutamate ligase